MTDEFVKFEFFCLDSVSLLGSPIFWECFLQPAKTLRKSLHVQKVLDNNTAVDF